MTLLHPHELARKSADFVICCAGACVFAAVFLLWSLLALVLRRVLSQDTGRMTGRAFIMLGFRACLAFLSLTGRFRFDLTELDALRDEKSLIIACNHPSLWDVVLLVSRLPDVSCIMKAGLVNNIFLGGGARLACYIGNESPRQMIGAAARDLQRGSHLLLFPEGTRTMRHPINPLTGSVGVIAHRARVPVQTVIIETDSAFLGKRWPLLKMPLLPMRYRVRLGRRFPAPDNRADFMAELEQYFMQELGAPQASQPSQASQATASPARSTEITH